MMSSLMVRAYSKDFLIIHTWRAQERKPIMEVWDVAPRAGVQGAEPPEADDVFVFKTLIFKGSAAGA